MKPSSRRRAPRLSQEPEAVTYAREKAGLTKRQAAERAGISEQLMGEIESGWRNATPEKLLILAAAFNCPIVVLEAKRDVGIPSAPAAEDDATEQGDDPFGQDAQNAAGAA